jgi:3-hydroxybutyrate dehydrogenase
MNSQNGLIPQPNGPSSSQRMHAVVTGGGSGAGADIAVALAQAGYAVTVIGRRHSTLMATCARHARIAFQVADVSDELALGRALDAASAACGPVVIAVANAGVSHSARLEDTTASMLQHTMDVNFRGTFNLWQATVPGMKRLGFGRLIAICSTAGLKGYGYVSAYVAAKHAVIGLTRALSIELATSGVTANAVCPGFMDTPMLQASIDNIVATTGRTAEQAAQALRAFNPQRTFVAPEAVASAVCWLASTAASHVNGHALALSGGEV